MPDKALAPFIIQKIHMLRYERGNFCLNRSTKQLTRACLDNLGQRIR